ncbi:MAG: NAD(+)--rifampin ADP-ribosyltransferase, partial [Terracoccus sp.]
MQTRSGDFELTMDELRAIAGYGLACAQPALILFQRDRPDGDAAAAAYLHPLSKATQVRHIL